MLEFYMAYATYEEMMCLTVGMIRAVDAEVRAAFPALTADRPFDLDADWKTIPMRDAIVDAAAAAGQPIERSALNDEAATAAFAEGLRGLEAPDRKLLAGCPDHGTRIFALYEVLAEPRLTELYRTSDGERSVPVFVTEYPFEVSPLARRNDDDPAFVDRFELFVDGREIANAFSELNDPDDQASRFEAQLARGKAGDDEAMDFDADYIRALGHGMPPAAGFGIGVDRLVMLLLGQPSIRDVLLFPLLRAEAE